MLINYIQEKTKNVYLLQEENNLIAASKYIFIFVLYKNKNILI
jgi:hypothetical protein